MNLVKEFVTFLNKSIYLKALYLKKIFSDYSITYQDKWIKTEE